MLWGLGRWADINMYEELHRNIVNISFNKLFNAANQNLKLFLILCKKNVFYVDLGTEESIHFTIVYLCHIIIEWKWYILTCKKSSFLKKGEMVCLLFLYAMKYSHNQKAKNRTQNKKKHKDLRVKDHFKSQLSIRNTILLHIIFS